MATTYEPIATTTLGSAAASITFSSIAATYTDLRLVLTAGQTSAADWFFIRFNGSTSTLGSYTVLQGNGSAASSFSSVNEVTPLGGRTGSSTNFGLSIIDVFSYAGSTNKTYLAEASADLNGSGVVARIVGLFRSTSAITTIKLEASSTFVTGTTATLYGIKNA